MTDYTYGIYVAGAYGERARALDAMQQVHQHPTTHLTRNWVEVIDRVRGDEGRDDADVGDQEAWEYARGDIRAIDTATVFWLLAPGAASKGAWFELGYAHGLLRWRIQPGLHDPLIVVSGPGCRSTVFTRVGRLIETDGAAFEYILTYLEVRRSGL